MSERGRVFCYTNHNVENPIPLDDEIAAHCSGVETCPTTGKKHIQGVAYFKTRKRLGGVIDKYPGIHWEVARGTWEQNVKYCWKEQSGDPVIWGTVPQQGQRGPWDEIKTKIEEGASVRDIILENPRMANYTRALHTLTNAIHSAVKREEVTIWWLYGAPGTGKSHWAREHSEDPYVTRIETDGRIWFNGYSTHQKYLIIEEAKSTDDSGLLREVLDKYDMLAPVKLGEPVRAGWTTVYITSNDNPPEFGPIADRISDVKRFDGVSRRKKRRIHGPESD